MEAHSGDGLVYRKTLPGSISRSAIVVAVHKIAGEEATVPPLIMGKRQQSDLSAGA
jgi:hypothetical protein